MKQKITVEEIQHIFEYGKLKNIVATILPNSELEEIGKNIYLKNEPYFYKGYQDIPAQNVPAHIKWYNNPIFAYVGIVDNQVEYRYTENGEGSYFICPVTNDNEEISKINKIFQYWYKYFNLPKSINSDLVENVNLTSDEKMDLIRNYLKTESMNDFEILAQENNVVFWVDWREEDDSIIQYCENIIQTGHLSAELFDSDNEMGFEIFINYKGEKYKIPYVGKGADRDTTINTLNEVLKPEYEIRFCKSSDGSDTLAFLPLSSEQWKMLEEDFGEERLTEHFQSISKHSVLFGRLADDPEFIKNVESIYRRREL